MPLPDQTPQLPKVPFLVGDAALLAAAWYIAAHAHHPLPIEQTLAIVACVGGAALVGVIPFLTDYARKQDVALDDRQRELEALARTVASSAEQISIAAQGLQEIAAVAQKNLRESVERPRPPEPRVDFQRTDAVRPERQKADKESSAALAAKTERLEAVAEQIARGAADWSKAEAAFQKMVETFEQLPARVRAEEKAETAARAADRPDATAVPAVAEKPEGTPTWESEPEPLPVAAATGAPLAAALAPPDSIDFVAPPVAPRATRKPRKPKVAAEPAPAVTEPVPVLESNPAAERVEESFLTAPVPVSAPVLPEPSVAPLPEPPAAVAAEPSVPEPTEFTPVSPDEAAPAPPVSSDGATRLLVTAYIGIGNRLFIRGDGPGLEWDKGVPLQFVSIGKWRWETTEAVSPIRFRLYKNDDIECINLGESILTPSRQHEMAATF
jgi:hypothetical protein